MTSRILLTRRIAAAGVAVVATVVLSACGTAKDASAQSPGAGQQAGDMAGMPSMSSSGSQGSAAFNDTDVAFAQMMIPDHKMVAKMATLAEKRANSAKLKSLAAQMRKGQSAAVEKLQGWLQDWGKPASDDMAGMSMPGAMSEQDMDTLGSMSGMQFDMMFAQMMIKHHEGSLQMVRDEQSKGASKQAKAMAADMQTTLQAQIDKLQPLAQM